MFLYFLQADRYFYQPYLSSLKIHPSPLKLKMFSTETYSTFISEKIIVVSALSSSVCKRPFYFKHVMEYCLKELV